METGMQVTPYEEMEKMDEQMVLDEIKGRAIDTLVYQIPQGGSTITGLSLSGVRETARVMNKQGQARIRISDKEPTVIETDDYFEVRIYAVDEMNGGGNWGIKRQEKKYARGGLNVFAYEQALAKAQRNAIRGLIPEWFVKQMIDSWIRAKSGVKVVNQQQPAQRAPQPATTQQAPTGPANSTTFWARATELKMNPEASRILAIHTINSDTGNHTDWKAALAELNAIAPEPVAA
ncbi:MAG: hypothetical protein H0U60_18595 [Blastocatellia bacterium]|nr:hypothetical protein [Blastocatellia bacterium]